jgi:DNA-binding GntR family transcriptional regulator
MNRGAVIPLVDKSYVDNLYKLRGAIQSMLAREAANLVTPAQIEQLLYLVKAYENAAQSSDTAVCVQANRKLHRFIDAIADNPLAVAMLDGRSSLVDAYRQTVGYGAGRLEVVLQQHRKIAGAVAAGNADLAAQAVIEHVDSSREDLIAILSSQEAKLK